MKQLLFAEAVSHMNHHRIETNTLALLQSSLNCPIVSPLNQYTQTDSACFSPQIFIEMDAESACSYSLRGAICSYGSTGSLENSDYRGL